ncbi:unnamed protein product, partial [Polarella glacialis]
MCCLGDGLLSLRCGNCKVKCNWGTVRPRRQINISRPARRGVNVPRTGWHQQAGLLELRVQAGGSGESEDEVAQGVVAEHTSPPALHILAWCPCVSATASQRGHHLFSAHSSIRSRALTSH